MGGFYDTRCNTCNGAGKVRENEDLERHERQLQYERGVNDAGEPLRM